MHKHTADFIDLIKQVYFTKILATRRGFFVEYDYEERNKRQD